MATAELPKHWIRRRCFTSRSNLAHSFIGITCHSATLLERCTTKNKSQYFQSTTPEAMHVKSM